MNEWGGERGATGADLEDQHQFWAELCLANMAGGIANLHRNPELPYFCIILSVLELEGSRVMRVCWAPGATPHDISLMIKLTDWIYNCL